MKYLKLTTENRRRISIAMIILAAVMLANVIYQTHMHMRWRSWLPDSLLITNTTTQPAEKNSKGPSKPPAVDPAIKKRNIFAKVGPKGHGMRLTGVLDTVAFFTDRKNKPVAIEQGKAKGSVKVLSINGYEVVIEYKGNTETMRLFSDKTRPAPAKTRPASKPAVERVKIKEPKAKRNIVHTEQAHLESKPTATQPAQSTTKTMKQTFTEKGQYQ